VRFVSALRVRVSWMQVEVSPVEVVGFFLKKGRVMTGRWMKNDHRRTRTCNLLVRLAIEAKHATIALGSHLLCALVCQLYERLPALLDAAGVLQ
jgi:hypothetical protein